MNTKQPVLIRLPPEMVSQIDHLLIDLRPRITRTQFIEAILRDALDKFLPGDIIALMKEES